MRFTADTSALVVVGYASAHGTPLYRLPGPFCEAADWCFEARAEWVFQASKMHVEMPTTPGSPFLICPLIWTLSRCEPQRRENAEQRSPAPREIYLSHGKYPIKATGGATGRVQAHSACACNGLLVPQTRELQPQRPQLRSCRRSSARLSRALSGCGPLRIRPPLQLPSLRCTHAGHHIAVTPLMRSDCKITVH